MSELERVQKTETRQRMISKSSLFLSICRAKVGERKLAAYDAVRIKTRYLSSWDKRHFVRLKNFLNDDFNVALKERNAPKKALHPLKFSLSPYGGQINYQTPSQKRRAGFQGFLGSIAYHDWAFIFGFEKFSLQGGTFPGFTQTQGHLALERKWTNGFSLAGRYTNMTSDTETQDGIQVLGLGGTYRLFDRTKLFADGWYSTYPDSMVGDLTVWQTDFALEQVLYKVPELILWAKAGLSQTVPGSSRIRNGESFIDEGVASRSYLDLFLRVRTVTLKAGFWAGREVFGVRNNGTMIFNTAEEHLAGQSAAASWDFARRMRFDLTYMNEAIRIDTTDSNARTTLGTFTYHFY